MNKVRAPQNAAAANTVTGPANIELLGTQPENIVLHRILDSELVTLTNISRPYSLALATMAFGAFIGFMPRVVSVITEATVSPRVVRGVKVPPEISPTDLYTVILAGVCLGASIILGCMAARGLIDASKAIKVIRSRPTTKI